MSITVKFAGRILLLSRLFFNNEHEKDGDKNDIFQVRYILKNMLNN